MAGHLTPAQIRGARVMLGWSMLDLARAASLSVSTVKRMEGAGSQAISDDDRDAVRGALEAAGASFLDDDGNGSGVRVRPR